MSIQTMVDPDKLEKAFGDLKKVVAAFLKSLPREAKMEEKPITKDHYKENTKRHAANFATILYRVACDAANDCGKKVYHEGISNNKFLLDAMMERREAALMVPAIRFDHLLHFRKVAAKDKATMVVGLHDSFAEFDTLRGTLHRSDLKDKLVRISTRISANIRELHKLTTVTTEAFLTLDRDEIVNVLRRLAVNLPATRLCQDILGSKPNQPVEWCEAVGG